MLFNKYSFYCHNKCVNIYHMKWPKIPLIFQKNYTSRFCVINGRNSFAVYHRKSNIEVSISIFWWSINNCSINKTMIFKLSLILVLSEPPVGFFFTMAQVGLCFSILLTSEFVKNNKLEFQIWCKVSLMLIYFSLVIYIERNSGVIK